IIKMYQVENQEVPEYVGWVYHNRGVLIAALMAEGIRLAIEQEGLPVTGEKVKKGFERIKDFTLGGFPLLTFTSEDHDAVRWLQIYQTKGEKLVPVTDWFRGYREVVQEEVKKAAKAEEKKP